MLFCGAKDRYSSCHHSQRGFTLIELLVAITILAVISTVGFATFSNAQIAARDDKRKQDLRSIATALELYYQRNKRYPCTGDNKWKWSVAGGTWITDDAFDSCGASSRVDLNENYINRLPKDPTNNGQPTWAGFYTYGYRENCVSCRCPTSLNGQYFLLVTNLENKNDPDSIRPNGDNQPTECNGSKIPWPVGTFAISSK